MQLYQLKFPNGKSYIGITSKTAQERFKQHCWMSQKNNPCQRAIHKYGKENVVLTVLATVDDWELLCLAEQEAIEKFNTFKPNGYNLTLGGDGSLKINLHGDERVLRDKELATATRKAYYDAQRIEINARRKEYNAKKAMQISARRKAYRAKNKEKISVQQKVYLSQNREQIKAQKKAYRAQQKLLASQRGCN